LPTEAIAPETVRDGGRPTVRHFRLLATLPTIATLDCTDCAVDDVAVEVVGRIKALERLVLVRTKVTGKCFSSMTELSSLRCVVLDETPLTDEGLERLCEIRSVEELSLAATNVTPKGLLFLQNLKRLHMLNLRATRTMPEGMKAVASLTQLRSLNLSQTAVDWHTCAQLVTLQSLERLVLQGSRIDHRAYRFLNELTSLHSLDVSRTRSPGRGIDDLTALTNLREFLVDGGEHDTRIALYALKDRLPNVSIAEAALDEVGVILSRDADGRIVSLKISGEWIFPIIAELANRDEILDVKHVSARRDRIRDEHMITLTLLKALRTVHLADTAVSRAGVEILLRSKSIEEIHVSAKTLSANDVEDLSKRFPGVRIVRD
jgi:hypothetical protein